jgi:DNA polymerase III delta prime subunit
MPITPGNTIDQLVGRSAELDVVRDAIDRLGAGHGSVLLFAGEPGIGKSTLARISADLASAADIPVYWGFSWEAGGAPAYWPWTQLLRSLVSEQTVAAEHLLPLAQILPEVATAESSQSELQPDQARFLLLESVRALLAMLAGNTPFTRRRGARNCRYGTIVENEPGRDCAEVVTPQGGRRPRLPPTARR